jgi:hypothetical protein
MKASSVGIDTINLYMPTLAFVYGHETTIATFKDMWLMMHV